MVQAQLPFDLRSANSEKIQNELAAVAAFDALFIREASSAS
jgi:hypothetical protein